MLYCIVHLPHLKIAKLSFALFEKKGEFLYIKLSSPKDCCTKRFTRCFSGRPIQSDIISAYMGSTQPRLNYWLYFIEQKQWTV